MNENLIIKNGQFGAVHSHNFTARGIHFFMNLMRWTKLEFKPFWKYILNHSLSGLPNNEIIEAIAKGTTIHDFNKAYEHEKNKTIYIFEREWSKEQLLAGEQIAHELRYQPYQFVNFIQFPIRILTFGLLWIGRRGEKAMKQTFCIEDQIIILFKMTVPELAQNDEDRQIHEMCKKYWYPTPVLYMKILDRFFKKVNEYSLAK